MYPFYSVQVVFRQGQLGFRPPIEEVKAKYYREMKKFLCIPNHFKGLDSPVTNDETKLIFPAIIDRNATHFFNVYSKAENLFQVIIQGIPDYIPGNSRFYHGNCKFVKMYRILWIFFSILRFLFLINLPHMIFQLS